jgi:hypothetical protein
MMMGLIEDYDRINSLHEVTEIPHARLNNPVDAGPVGSGRTALLWSHPRIR